MRLHKTDLIHPEISLRPLIDVFLVLVIILLVVAPMVRASARAAVTKPAAGPASVLAIEEPQLAVSMAADGTLYVDGRRVPVDKLQSVLGEIWSLTPNRPVVVKGDRHLRYEQVRWVLQSVSAAGFRRAGLTADARRSR